MIILICLIYPEVISYMPRRIKNEHFKLEEAELRYSTYIPRRRLYLVIKQ